MMRCLLGCFRVAGGADDGGGGRREVKRDGGSNAEPVAPSLASMTSHEVCAGRRAKPPSRNALSAVFLREDEGSGVELTASSWANRREDWKRGEDLKHETIMQEVCEASQGTTNEHLRVLKDADSVHQIESGPSMFDNVHFKEALNAEDCETPSRSNQSSSIHDAMSSSKASKETQTPATSNATYLDGLTKDKNTEASTQNEHHALDSVENYEKCGVSIPREDFIQVDQPAGDPNSEKNGNFVSMEITLSEECSLFQSSVSSVSSFNKINDSTDTTSMKNSLTTEVTTHATRKKVLKNSDSEMEFPSLSQWLKPPNPKKPFRDEALTGERSAKSSDEDRPIIGMVAAHWKDEEPEKLTPKWWDGNGIPNSTNKYREDQKVSWHPMSFEERLEKALSEEKLLSESNRNCFSGKTSHCSGMESDDNDTAESCLYAVHA